MTTQTKTLMVVQGLAFVVYWPITIDLSYSANHPPMSVLVATALLSLLLGVAFVSANLIRDRCLQDPVTRSLYNSFQFFAVTTSLCVISVAAAICRVLRMPPAQRGASFYEIDVILAIIGISLLTLCWSLLRWWRARRRDA